MKKQQLFKLSLLIAIATMTVGCKEEPKPQKKPELQQPATQIVQSSGTTLAELQSSGVSNITLKSTAKEYKSGQAIEFIVNTKQEAGYLYIIYLDNSGATQLLYPNANSPLTELSGEYVFPRDFGNISIQASKDCGECSEDKTTIYALLTKEPVADIKNITKAHLLKFSGEKSASSQGKGISMNLGDNGGGNSSNITFGKIEFLVK